MVTGFRRRSQHLYSDVGPLRSLLPAPKSRVYNATVLRPVVNLILAFVLASSANNVPRSRETQIRHGVYTSADLGFSFTPPSGLRDLTAAVNQAGGGSPANGRSRFEVLLWMASGPDDTAPDWLSLGIETYRRGRDRDSSDDLTASFITNYAVAGGMATERKVVRLSGLDFAMTRVERKEPPLTKYAVVYTTVRKEKFLSFWFSGNTREGAEKIAQSINSVRFGNLGHRDFSAARR